MDHTGAALGMGDPRCFEDPPDIFDTECNLNLLAGQEVYCKTDLISDWLPSGVMEIKIKRSCEKWIPGQLPGDKCNEGHSGLFYYRDCAAFCQTSNCNDAKSNDIVIDMATKKEDGKPREQTCLSCNTRNGDDVAACRTNPSNLPNGVKECPAWANYGCFNANKFPADGELPCIGNNCIGNPGEEQYSKGCSPFLFTQADGETPVTGSQCEHVIADGAPYESCKKTCDTDKCNIGAVFYTPSCYTCSVTVDHTGAAMGWGDLECIDGALERHLEHCSSEQDVCVTEMVLDWRPSGMQTTTVRVS